MTHIDLILEVWKEQGKPSEAINKAIRNMVLHYPWMQTEVPEERLSFYKTLARELSKMVDLFSEEQIVEINKAFQDREGKRATLN